MRLGEVVNGIRQGAHVGDCPHRRQLLDSMGFCWDQKAYRFALLHAALVVYKQRHGDLLVPQHFMVPADGGASSGDSGSGGVTEVGTSIGVGTTAAAPPTPVAAAPVVLAANVAPSTYDRGEVDPNIKKVHEAMVAPLSGW